VKPDPERPRNIEILAYNLETVLAEKFETIISIR